MSAGSLTRAIMHIWVDADACPAIVKDMLFRAAQRIQVHVTLVANQYLRTPSSPFVHAAQVPSGPDPADTRIVELAQVGDIVVTADIPLAAQALAKGASALDPRGNWFTADNIEERLKTRAMLDQLRGGGVDTGGPAPYHPRDGKAFADALDRFLARRPPAGPDGTPR
jgi:uncharacterized protein YaiI (UPF0178 family)